jgi:hypothetical protein
VRTKRLATLTGFWGALPRHPRPLPSRGTRLPLGLDPTRVLHGARASPRSERDPNDPPRGLCRLKMATPKETVVSGACPTCRRGRHRDAQVMADALIGRYLGHAHPEVAMCEVCGRAVLWPNSMPNRQGHEEVVRHEQMTWLGGPSSRSSPPVGSGWTGSCAAGPMPSPTARTTPAVPLWALSAGSQRLVAQAGGPEGLCSGPD